MLHLALDFVNAPDIEAGVRAQELRRLRRHHPQLRQRLRGRQLHLQPLLKFVLVAPDPAHFGPRISRNHDVSPEDAPLRYGFAATPRGRSGSAKIAELPTAGSARRWKAASPNRAARWIAPPPSARSRDDYSAGSDGPGSRAPSSNRDPASGTRTSPGSKDAPRGSSPAA